MADARPRGPDGPAKEPAALASLLKCPNCGREPAVVFPLIREYDESVTDAPRVCFGCCAEARGRR
jgi:hypothetical protein